MARKRILISWLAARADTPEATAAIGHLTACGLAVESESWNFGSAAAGCWQIVARLAGEAAPDLWLVVGRRADFEQVPVRFALSVVHASVGCMQGRCPVMATAALDGSLPCEALPPLLGAAPCLSPPASRWGPALVALAARPPQQRRGTGELLCALVHPTLGLWFAAGPLSPNLWSGSVIGVDEGEITHQAVGPAGRLPERSIIEYPSQGLQIEAGGRRFACWSVHNVLRADQLHYVRVAGHPHRILFGELPKGDAGELRVLSLV